MIIHVVRQGDSVYSLAQMYGTTPLKIIEDNELNDPTDLVIGQTLVILTGEIPENLKEIAVFGYAYPNIRERVLASALPHMTGINIFNYMVTEDGNLIYINDENLIKDALEYQVAPYMVLTNLEPGGGFSSEIMQKILNNDHIQDVLINNVLDTVKSKGYFGVDVDFEYVYPEDKEKFEDFLRKLATVLHSEGYKINAALAPKISREQKGLLYEAHDYAVIGDIMDKILLMTYEWGFMLGPPMAVAPINQVERVLQYAVTEIDSQKILMGIPNYGYDWTLPYEKGTKATIISNPEAVDIARRHGAEIKFDYTAQSPYFNYYDEEKREHIVWFEDARSIDAKLKLVDKYNLGGIFYWTIMNPFPQNWLVLENTYSTIKYL
ncbi:MAG TPA: spore gernimation protein [Clostridiales bacterium]|nr:spore gernimation protein [Clostridiales bacterium]